MTLAVEVMGRHSNIILVDGEGRIVDAIKRVDLEMSSVRPSCPDCAMLPRQPRLGGWTSRFADRRIFWRRWTGERTSRSTGAA